MDFYRPSGSSVREGLKGGQVLISDVTYDQDLLPRPPGFRRPHEDGAGNWPSCRVGIQNLPAGGKNSEYRTKAQATRRRKQEKEEGGRGWTVAQALIWHMRARGRKTLAERREEGKTDRGETDEREEEEREATEGATMDVDSEEEGGRHREREGVSGDPAAHEEVTHTADTGGSGSSVEREPGATQEDNTIQTAEHGMSSETQQLTLSDKARGKRPCTEVTHAHTPLANDDGEQQRRQAPRRSNEDRVWC